MGCGSSSLKGDPVSDPNGDNMPPAKRVQTNFSEIDFDRGAAPDRRGTMAVAPDEHNRSAKISEEISPHPKTPTKTESSAEKARQNYQDGAKLEPYKSIDGTEGGSTEMNTMAKNVNNTPDIQVAGKPGNEEAATLSAVMNNTPNPVRA